MCIFLFSWCISDLLCSRLVHLLLLNWFTIILGDRLKRLNPEAKGLLQTKEGIDKIKMKRALWHLGVGTLFVLTSIFYHFHFAELQKKLFWLAVLAVNDKCITYESLPATTQRMFTLSSCHPLLFSLQPSFRN